MLLSNFSESFRMRTGNYLFKKKIKNFTMDRVQSEKVMNSAEEGALGIFAIILGITKFMKWVCLIKL